MIDQKVNWGEDGKKPEIPTEEVKKVDKKSIAAYKKEMNKHIVNLISDADKLYDMEPTTTLSSIKISLGLLLREFNKIK